MAGMDIGRIGIWSMELRFGDKILAAQAAAELDVLGYGAIWVPGGIGGALMDDLDHLFGATSRLTIASGILNVWKHDPAEVAGWFKALAPDRQARVLLGLGVSHSHIIGETWGKPLALMRDYLDRLDAEGMPADQLCLAALGPRMLELSGRRSAGAHPYLITPAHTASARAVLGQGPLLAPEQGVVLESDPAKARELARGALSAYLQYPNYRNSWARLGFTEADMAGGGSDRLVDALFAWGSAEDIAARVQAHLAAGADHVCLQVVTGAGLDVNAARPIWRELAGVLIAS